MPSGSQDANTNPTIFLRMNGADPAPREFAWSEFESRYAPIIQAFARHLGARPQDIDDIVQDVLLGFFLKSPTFVYDSSKGRFRGYLKVCTYRAAHHRLGREAKFQGRSLDAIDPSEMAIEQAWDDAWERQLLRRTLDELRKTVGQSKTFLAFEAYGIRDESAADVAAKLDMHINSVYRAKEQMTKLLQEKMLAMRDED